MPQKNNPMRSEQILAAARSVAAQLTALMGALVQEHERGTHGWQVEWLCLSPMLSLAAGACKNALEIARDLVVDADRMRANVMSGQGLVLAEPAVGALSDPTANTGLSRSAARALLAAIAARPTAKAARIPRGSTSPAARRPHRFSASKTVYPMKVASAEP